MGEQHSPSGIVRRQLGLPLIGRYHGTRQRPSSMTPCQNRQPEASRSRRLAWDTCREIPRTARHSSCEMKADNILIERNECLVWAFPALNLRFPADPSNLVVPTHGRITRLAALRILPVRIRHRPVPGKGSEECNLVGGRRTDASRAMGHRECCVGPPISCPTSRTCRQSVRQCRTLSSTSRPGCHKTSEAWARLPLGWQAWSRPSVRRTPFGPAS
jgi:hypothetical protein